jgi:hypothetical protein
MPRYPQGVTSFIPSYQAYQPDFTMMGKMLSIRQNQYDQNWKRLNDVYGSLLYADTTHEQSQEVKDQLKNEIDFNLRRVSGLDLSLQKNVQSAQQVFQPFYENNSLMYDMAATKNVNASIAKADSYKNSADPNMSGLYWNEGMDFINYKMQEFKETPYDQIQSSGLAQVNYTPHYNLGQEALAIMDKIGSQTFSESDGKYDKVTTNGSKIINYLKQVFETNLGQDPRFQAMYNVEAYLNRKNYINSNAAAFGGDKLAAERQYLESTYKLLGKDAIITNDIFKKNAEGVKKQQELLLDPNSEYVPGQEEAIQKVNQQNEIAQQSLNKSTEYANMVSVENNRGQQNPFEDLNILRRKVDYLNANAIMQKKVGEQAQLLAYKDYKQEVSLNEEYKIRLENDLAIQRDMMAARVKAGTHNYTTDASGKATGKIEPVAGVDDYIKVQDQDITADSQDVRETVKTIQTDRFDNVKSYLEDGIKLIQSIGLDKISGGQEDVLKMIGVTKDSKGNLVSVGKSQVNSIKDLSNAISSYDTFKESGLSLTDLFNVTKNIRNIIFRESDPNGIDYSVLLQKTYGKQGSPDRQAVNNWLQGSYENTDNIDEMIANKNYLSTKRDEIVIYGKTKPKSELFAAQFAVDSYGKGVGEEQYIKNVQNYIGKDYVNEYINSMNLDAEAERKVRADAAKAWDKYSAIDPRFYYKAVGGYLNAAANFYKIKGIRSFFTEYLNPLDLGKYELYNEARLKYDMPDYEDVLESFGNEFKNSNRFKDSPPSLIGSGTGTSGMSAQGTVVAGAGYTQLYQDFYGTGNTNIGIVDDIRNMMANPSKTIYSAYSTSLLAKNEEKNTKEHQEAVKFIIGQVMNPTNNKEIGNFDITIKPGTAFDGTKGGYQIKLSQESLNKYIQKANDEGVLTNIGVASADILKPLLKNGLTIISDQVLLNSDAWQGGTADAIASTLRSQIAEKRIINKTNDTRVSKSYPLGGGFKITYDIRGYAGNESYDLMKTSKIFDLQHYINTGKLKTLQSPSSNVNPKSLTQQRKSFIENKSQLELANKQLILQTKAAIESLRSKNPGITNQQIYNILKSLYD